MENTAAQFDVVSISKINLEVAMADLGQPAGQQKFEELAKLLIDATRLRVRILNSDHPSPSDAYEATKAVKQCRLALDCLTLDEPALAPSVNAVLEMCRLFEAADSTRRDFRSSVKSAVKAVAAEIGAAASISLYEADGDHCVGSYFKILVDAVGHCRYFDFRMTKKGWIRIRAVSGGYTAALDSGRRFFEVDGVEYERKAPVARTVAELPTDLIATYSSIGDAMRREIRPFVAIWSTTPPSSMMEAA